VPSVIEHQEVQNNNKMMISDTNYITKEQTNKQTIFEIFLFPPTPPAPGEHGMRFYESLFCGPWNRRAKASTGAPPAKLFFKTFFPPYSPTLVRPSILRWCCIA
jgi:hypothetical protein